VLLLLLLQLVSPKLLLLHPYPLLLPLILIHPLQPVAPLQLLLQLQPSFLRLTRVRGRSASSGKKMNSLAVRKFAVLLRASEPCASPSQSEGRTG
jgi:hypothetical protein